jgi:hypothetical protein
VPTRNEQGEQYLDLMYGENKGYVAVAAKNGPSGQWQEQVFLWPHDKTHVMDWAEANRDGDVFICPALRKTKAREKNGGAHLSWLWADVDWQDVPPNRRNAVRKRIDKIAGMQVSSGSGDNVHVYVKLDRPATLDVWKRLNAGLRIYLCADAKHTDNALLRLPGTINHKPAGGRVQWLTRWPEGRTVRAADLLKRQEWRDVVMVDDRAANDGAYDTVDVSHLLRGEIKRRTTMDTDEAIGRYGTRHGAVYQVSSWLSKKGLTADQIHTLMAEFPAGVDKEETERGYSLHKDIDRCLGTQPTVEALEIVDDVFEIIQPGSIDDQETTDDSLLLSARKRLRTWDVEELAHQLRAQRIFTPPPDDVSYTWAQRCAMPRPPVQFAVDRIAAVGQNVTITGQYKAGKTLLGLNLIKSLIEGEPFLGEFKVGGADGVRSSIKVGLWSLEMSVDDLDGYIDPMAVDASASERLAVLSGRGYGINILTDVGKQWAVNWLKRWAVQTWVIDSHARLCRMAGVDENDNGAVLGLLHRLDEIKEAAGVGELFYLVHTGRSESGADAGMARARGATVLDDWADTRWVLTRQGAVRFLSIEGRNVTDLEARSLDFDKETGLMVLGTHDPVSAKVDGLVALVVSLVADHPGEYNERALRNVVKERAGGAGIERIRNARDEAIVLGAIRAVDGPRGEKRYWPSLTEEASDQALTVGDTVKRTNRATCFDINPRNLTDLQIRAESRKRQKRGARRGVSKL